MLKNIYYKELFLYGFYISFILISLFATVIDFFIDNHQDIIFEVVATIIASICFGLYIKNRDYEFASVAIFWISSGVVFSFIIQNGFDVSVIFTLLIPLVAFILLSVKKILIHVGIYFVLLGGIFLYGYEIFKEEHFLSEAKYIGAYIVAMLFVIAFGIFYHIAIEESYHRLEELNRQKTFLLKEIHHRVKNNLNIISSILGLQKLKSDSKEVHDIIDQNRLRLESMAIAHETLYRYNNLSKIEFRSYIEKVAKNILKIEAQKDEIELKIDIQESIFLNIESMIQFGMLINELMTNSIKYAFKDAHGIINISMYKQDNGYLFHYFDNGIGIDYNLYRKGFGTSLIEMSIEQLGGKMVIENRDGLHYYIFFRELK